MHLFRNGFARRPGLALQIRFPGKNQWFLLMGVFEMTHTRKWAMLCSFDHVPEEILKRICTDTQTPAVSHGCSLRERVHQASLPQVGRACLAVLQAERPHSFKIPSGT